MLRLPYIESDLIQRLMSERLLALTECHMNKDGSLAEGEELALFPEGTSYEKANYEFQSLRKLLHHPKPFTPELIGEYLMNSMIEIAIDLDRDPNPNPCLHLASARFPEKERAELVSEFGEEDVASYEDLRNSDDTLFWDNDFVMLDFFAEGRLLASDMNSQLGIGPANGSVIDLDGKKVAVTVREWEID